MDLPEKTFLKQKRKRQNIFKGKELEKFVRISLKLLEKSNC